MYKSKDVMVFSADIARWLLKRGYTICDIKPDKFDPDRKKTVFVFKDEPGIRETIHELLGIDELEGGR